MENKDGKSSQVFCRCLEDALGVWLIFRVGVDVPEIEDFRTTKCLDDIWVLLSGLLERLSVELFRVT